MVVETKCISALKTGQSRETSRIRHQRRDALPEEQKKEE